MCLSAKQTIKGLGSEKVLIKRAHKNITVYKVLVPTLDTFRAPYQHSFVYHKGLNFPKQPSKNRIFEKPKIFDGWLHAYIDQDRAFSVAEWSNDVVIKMVIPRGARYILGTIGDVCASCLKW